jgi:hypothetical protein
MADSNQRQVVVRIGTQNAHTQAKDMQFQAESLLAALPEGAPGRKELSDFKDKVSQAVDLLKQACDKLGPIGANPMYRDYTLPLP